ncbi:MAG: hypothetical protein SNJ66_13345 [Chloroherpetonaceae bacterium]
MLDTLLQIGRTFREAKRLKHHRYIKPAPAPDPKGKTIIKYLSLPVSEDFKFDFERISEIPENERGILYYPTFKTSDADGLVKYLFGDIFYGFDKEGKELGYYRMADPSVKAKGFQVSSFYRCKEDAKFFEGKSDVIIKFRAEYEKSINRIEFLLLGKDDNGNDLGYFADNSKSSKMIFLHFDFQGNHWYHFEKELALINEKMFEDFLEYSDKANGYVLDSFLYKTLGGDTPMFRSESKYKNRFFRTTDDVLDLVYAIDYSKKAIIAEKNIKIVILPKGNNLLSEHIEEFFEKKSAIEEEEVKVAEKKIKQATVKEEEITFDSIFEPVVNGVPENIVQFDFIFSKKADSPSTPDVDILEIAGIEKSLLSRLSERIREIRRGISKERNELYPKRPKNFINLEVRNAFKNILGDLTKGQKKYQSHLFKVLPQIYTGTYYRDDVLLPAFIEKTEFHIRNDEPNYNLLKYDFYFLTKIQNSTTDRLMEIENSSSYKAGLLLGKMAKPLNNKINSFQKNYVGLLSRRISDKRSLIDFANFINEKLAIHDVAYPDLQRASVEFAEIVSKMTEKEYMKNECAFGFFESYFKYEPKKADEESQDTEPNLFNN